MKLWGGLLLVALACLSPVTLATAAEGGEKGQLEVKERRLSALLFIDGSDGYDATIATRGHRQVTLTLRRGGTEVEARTDGRVTHDAIEADFGELGKVSLRLKAGGLRVVRPQGECRGRPRVLEMGTFEGTIRFHGDALPQLDAKSAWGFVQQRYRQVCPAGAKGNSIRAVIEKLLRGIRVTILRSHARVGGATVLFEAESADLSSLFGGDRGYESNFSARMVERHDGVRLARSVGAEGGEASFRFSKKGARPQAATVTPPGKPFTGSAEYLKEKGQPAGWSGSLAARIPGAGLVALTGPGFRPDFCRLVGAQLLDGEGCPPGSKQGRAEALRLLGPMLPQGKGSQSQAFWDARLSWSR